MNFQMPVAQFQLFPIPVQCIHSWRDGIMPSLALAVALTSDERAPVRVIGGLESFKGKIAGERWKKKTFLFVDKKITKAYWPFVWA